MFFRISNKCHDGLLFLGKLASRWESGEFLSVEEGARTAASAGYLEQIITPLRTAGLVEAKRGPGGGYRLAKHPKETTVRDAVEALEGKISLVDCQGSGCDRVQSCGSEHLWNTLQQRIGETLGNLTLADIAERGE
jgi:Rrf2 family protein